MTARHITARLGLDTMGILPTCAVLCQSGGVSSKTHQRPTLKMLGKSFRAEPTFNFAAIRGRLEFMTREVGVFDPQGGLNFELLCKDLP